jgi:hypothetical protein
MLRGKLYLLYVDDVRTSQVKHAFTAYYGDSFTFSYTDDDRTSQETRLHCLLRG